MTTFSNLFFCFLNSYGLHSLPWHWWITDFKITTFPCNIFQNYKQLPKYKEKLFVSVQFFTASATTELHMQYVNKKTNKVYKITKKNNLEHEAEYTFCSLF